MCREGSIRPRRRPVTVAAATALLLMADGGPAVAAQAKSAVATAHGCHGGIAAPQLTAAAGKEVGQRPKKATATPKLEEAA